MADREYRIQAPDGSILRIVGPEDATPDQLRAVAERAFASRQAAPTTRIQPEVQAQRDQGRLDILQGEREQIQQRAQAGDQRAAEDLQAIDREIARTRPAAARAAPAAAPAPAPAMARAPLPNEIPRPIGVPEPERKPEPSPGLIDRIVGELEAAGALVTGATTGPLSAANVGVREFVRQLLAGQLGTEAGNVAGEQALRQGMAAGTYVPRTQLGREYAGQIGGALQQLPPYVPVIAPAVAPGAAAAQQVRARATRPQAVPIPRIEPTLDGAPVGAATPEVQPAVMPATPPVAPAAPAPAMTPQQLAATARTASEGGLGSTRATSVLAGQAAPDPKVLESARRLGIDQYLQPDHLTTNQAYRELAQAVKSIPGSQTRVAEIQGLTQVGQRADRLIAEIGGTTDLSRLNQVVRGQLDSTVAALSKQADNAYEALRRQIPSQTRGEAANVLDFVERRAADLDGPENLSELEKMVRRKLTPKPIKDKDGNVIGVRAPTYELIDDVRRDIGAAARQKGPFADADTGLAKQLYSLIDDDQFALAQTTGQGENYRLAKSLVQMRKGFEDDMVSLFGRQLDQSLVGKLESATMSLSKGDADKLANILNAIPKDMRQMVTASALNTAFGKATQNGTLNFTTYAKWYEGLLANKQAYSALMVNLPQPARKQLSDLYRVASNVSKATRERITTGRIQAVQQELQGADNLLSNIYGVAKRAAIGVPIEAVSASIGLPGAGVASGLTAALTKGKPNTLKAADELISSPEFQRLAVETVSTGNKPSSATLRRTATSGAFSRFASAVNLPSGLDARMTWLQSALQAGAIVQAGREISQEPQQ